MTAYNIPEEITYETTGPDGAPQVKKFEKGEVVPADAQEAALLAAFVAAGIATVATKSNPKPSKTTPSESKE